MLRKTVIVATSIVASAFLTACPPPRDPSSTTTTTRASTPTTHATVPTPPAPKPCPAAPANTTPGPDSLTESPISSWGVGGVTGGGGFTATVLGDVVYVGGLFSQAIPPSGAPVARSNLAAFCLANGQLLAAFKADTNAQVWALTNDGKNVFAAGNFTSVNGQPSNRLVKLDPLTGAMDTTTFKPPTIPDVALALDYSAVTGDVYAGGDFRLAGLGGGPNKGGSFDHVTGAFTGWNPKADARIESLSVSANGQNVFIGGNFSTVGGQAHDKVARTAASNGAVNPTLYGANQNVPGWIGAHVLSMDVDSDSVSPYVSTGLVSPAGSMSGGGNKAMGLNADGTERWKKGFNGDAQAIVLVGNNVYVGFHDGFQNNTARRVVGFTASTGGETAFQPNANGHPLGVRGLAAGAGRLIAVGDFTLMGTTTALHGLAIFP